MSNALWAQACEAATCRPDLTERYTKWLLDQRQYAHAAHALQQALHDPHIDSPTRQRLQRRLNHCKKRAHTD